jgi:ABC-type transport system involved in multi-copper enzyme maturation permease subunit
MIDTIRSEFLKIRTTRTAGGLLVGLLLLASLALWASIANATPAELATALSSTHALVAVLVAIPAIVLVLGIRSFTDEVRHGSVVPTFLATPDRRRVLAAKVIVIAATSAVFALVALAFGVAVVTAYLSTQGIAPTVAWGAIGSLTGKVLVITALWSTIGVAIGAVIRHQVAAIVGTLGWLLIGESLVSSIVPGPARWLPGQAGVIALGIDPHTSTVLGAIVFAGWAVVAATAAAVSLTRRDVA